MAKKEEGLCVGESNREWQETAPCNEIQTVAIYSTHFSTGRNRSSMLGML